MKNLLFLLIVALFCACSSQKSGVTSRNSNESVSKSQKAKIVEGKEEGEWFLENAQGQRVAKIYVEMGSTVPDRFQNRIIRIVSPDGLKVGYANDLGDVIVPPIYFAAMPALGTLAPVVPYSEATAASATDEAPSRILNGNERWGIVDLSDGRFLRNPVFHRSWNYELGRYVFSCPTSTFWINDAGELQGF